MKIDLEDYNWHGFNHIKMIAKLNCTRYVGTFCIRGQSSPVAVYYSENPDKAKNHKNYVLVHEENGSYYVRGMEPEEMEKYRFQDGVHCPKCKDVIYSIHRHDMRFCKCGECSIDGGRDYTKRSLEGDAVKIDLVKGESI